MLKPLLWGNALLLAVLIVLLWIQPLSTRAFRNTELVFLAPGRPEHQFSQRVHQGALDAAADLGCGMKVLWNGWNPDETVLEFKRAIEMQPDAICIPGFPRTPEFDAFVGEAVRSGIKVTSYNVLPPEFLDEYGAHGFGYAGQNNFEAGRRLVRALKAQLDLQPGDRAVIFGMPSAPDRGDRARGCAAEFQSLGITADVVDTFREADDEPLAPSTIIAAYLADHPDVKVMIWESYPAHVAAQVLRELGYGPGEIPIAGWDLNPEILDEVESGYVVLTYDQQPYLQGYLAVLQSCLSHERGFAVFVADTSGPFVDKSSVGALRGLVDRRYR
ncbi:MAG: substrate-binding domain-containing protein [Candidatus Hydrogenedentes bacterium]|nr:substrate-binding domain-containing protein [Candidatus Hydrogenedentota bacterium]